MTQCRAIMLMLPPRGGLTAMHIVGVLKQFNTGVFVTAHVAAGEPFGIRVHCEGTVRLYNYDPCVIAYTCVERFETKAKEAGAAYDPGHIEPNEFFPDTSVRMRALRLTPDNGCSFEGFNSIATALTTVGCVPVAVFNGFYSTKHKGVVNNRTGRQVLADLEKLGAMGYVVRKKMGDKILCDE